jgi:hypothetical protein
MLRLECPDLFDMLERQPDIVQPVQDALFAEGVNVKVKTLSARRRDTLLLQIDREPVALIRLGFPE